MRYITLVTMAFACAVKSVQAADLPVYTPVAPTPVFTWAGIYVGVNAGYGWAHGSGTSSVTGNFFGTFVGTGTSDFNGAIVGGQVGWNYQTGPIVFGVEVDAQWSDQKKTTTTFCGFGCALNETDEIDAFGTARGRFGVALDRFLLYTTAGLAWTSAKASLNATGFGTTLNIVSIDATKIGWTVGAGVEAAIAGGLSAKVEYLYIETSGLSGSAPFPLLLGGGTASLTADIHNSIVRAGLNYRF